MQQSSLGARLDAPQLVATLDHIFQANLDAEVGGGRGTPVCVWGLHGIGKTMIVEELARSRGWQYAYLSPAQFEEMGDLNGLPVLTEDGRTAFAPPSWVPATPGPGVLLIDDINRADDRILRGLMQLLSDGRLASWALPPHWHIVATANPDDGDYSVTSMDEAILSRMMHVTMTFNVEAWAAWARRNGLDERGIEFVLAYPEIVSGRRTTPRSLTQFLRAIASIKDLHESIDLVQTLGLSSLDEATVGSFVAHVTNPAGADIKAVDILDAADFATVAARLRDLAGSGSARTFGSVDASGANGTSGANGASGDGGGSLSGHTNVDRLALVCSRLVKHLTAARYRPKPRHAENLIRFLTEAPLPKDLLAGTHRDLVGKGSAEVREMMRDKRVADMLVSLL